jgi:hypothetical protein
MSEKVIKLGNGKRPRKHKSPCSTLLESLEKTTEKYGEEVLSSTGSKKSDV